MSEKPWYVNLSEVNVKRIKNGQKPLNSPLEIQPSNDKIYEGIKSPIDGHVFKGKKDYEEYKKRHNLATYGD